jgi:RimJ/RimL family protein N-acetyltransferase
MRALDAPETWQRRTALRDGTRVLLRPVEPEDRGRLVRGFRELSPTSRYLRFHHQVEELTPAQLDHLTVVDHRDHEAIVALDLARPSEPGVGVARYVRDHYERHVAEAVVTVADRYHGRGAATLLIGTLAARAREQGITVFRNHVLDDNPVMLGLLERLGATRERVTAELWQVDLPLPANGWDLPDPRSDYARAFRAANATRGGVACTASHGRHGRRPARGRWQPLAASITAALVEDTSAEAQVDWLADRDARRTTWPTAG